MCWQSKAAACAAVGAALVQCPSPGLCSRSGCALFRSRVGFQGPQAAAALHDKGMPTPARRAWQLLTCSQGRQPLHCAVCLHLELGAGRVVTGGCWRMVCIAHFTHCEHVVV
jgi:hypothetical protein